MTARLDTDAQQQQQQQQQQRAWAYKDARPPYPSQAADFVVRHVGRRDAAADIGCGTGLSTTVVCSMADTVVGVEPDTAMLGLAQARLGERARLLHGSAEKTGLSDASIDLVVAASCMEWFDRAAAQAEFRRILRPNGWVLLMWHHRVVLDRESRTFDDLWAKLAGPRLGPHPEDIDGIVAPSFLHGPIRRWERTQWHRFDAERLASLASSSAYFDGSSEGSRTHWLLRDFARRAGGQVLLPFRAVAYLGRVRPA